MAKAAHLAGVSYDRMKALLLQRGIQPRLGPENMAEATEELANLKKMLTEQ